MEKHCWKCDEWKPAASFSKDKSRRDGLQAQCKDCNRSHYSENKRRIQAKNRTWEVAHPERVREYRQRRVANGKHSDYIRRWKREHPDKVARAHQQRSQRMQVTDEVQREIDEYTQVILSDPCVYCGCRSEQADHIVPLSRSGQHDWTNLAPVCAPCNVTKHTKGLLEFLMYRDAALAPS